MDHISNFSIFFFHQWGQTKSKVRQDDKPAQPKRRNARRNAKLNATYHDSDDDFGTDEEFDFSPVS